MVIADAVLTFIASTLLGAFAAALLFEERQNIAGIAAVLIGLSALILQALSLVLETTGFVIADSVLTFAASATLTAIGASVSEGDSEWLRIGLFIIFCSQALAIVQALVLYGRFAG